MWSAEEWAHDVFFEWFKMWSAEEYDVLFEWLITDPYPTKLGIEKPSDHEERQRKMMTDIITGKMRSYARECVEAWRDEAVKQFEAGDIEHVFTRVIAALRALPVETP